MCGKGERQRVEKERERERERERREREREERESTGSKRPSYTVRDLLHTLTHTPESADESLLRLGFISRHNGMRRPRNLLRADSLASILRVVVLRRASKASVRSSS